MKNNKEKKDIFYNDCILIPKSKIQLLKKAYNNCIDFQIDILDPSKGITRISDKYNTTFQDVMELFKKSDWGTDQGLVIIHRKNDYFISEYQPKDKKGYGEIGWTIKKPNSDIHLYLFLYLHINRFNEIIKEFSLTDSIVY